MPFISAFNGSFYIRLLELGSSTSAAIPLDFTAAKTATPTGGNLGTHVVMSGDGSTLIMPDYTDNSLSDFSGAVYVYTSNNGSWEYIEKITPTSLPTGINGGYYYNFFGYSVSLTDDGSRMVVLASRAGTTGSGANQSGLIYVYDRQPDNTFTETQRIDRPRSSHADPHYGDIRITGDGSKIIVSLFEDINSDGIYHSIDVYDYNSVTGTYSRGNTVSAGTKQVSAYFYKNTGANRNTRVAISDNGLYALFSAPDDGEGKVYAASFNGSNWSSDGALSRTGSSFDYGQALSLSADGSVAAISSTSSLGSDNVSIRTRVGNTWSQQQLIPNPNPDGNDYPFNFGLAVKLLADGKTLFVYAPRGDNSATTAKIYVYTESAGVWSLAETIDTGWITNRTTLSVSFNQMSMEVSSDGKVVVLSDNQNDTVEFFETTGGPYYTEIVVDTGVIADFSNPTLSYTLDNPNAYSTAANDNFGDVVAINDTYAAIGVPLEDDASGTSSGKVYVFNLSDGSLTYTLNNPSEYSTGADDYFGHSIAMSDTHIIVGAPYEDRAGTQSGSIYIFDLSDGSLTYTITNPDPVGEGTGDYFGWSVAISGNYAIAGAPYYDETGTITQSGRAYIFNMSTGLLEYTLDNPNAYYTATGDYFGISVAISDTRAIVGAHQEDNAVATNVGKAYIFDMSTGLLEYTLDNPTNTAVSLFGENVAITDNYAVVTASREESTTGQQTSGRVYIYNLSDGSLRHTLYNPEDPTGDEHFGHSLDVSSTHVIIGAHRSGSSQSGAAYIFDISDGSLVSKLDNPNAYDTIVSDEFGISVAIYGANAIVGAHQEDEEFDSNSGKAYMFQGYLPATEATMLSRAYLDTSDANVEYDYYSGDIKILDNGTKVLYSGNYRDGSNNVRRDLRIATLNTPYEIASSTTATGILEIENLPNFPMLNYVAKDHWISNDGMTLYLMFSNYAVSTSYWYRSIYKFSLSSAWDITTVTTWNPTQQFTLTDSTASEEAAGMGSSNHFPINFWFNNDGSKLFVTTGYANQNQDYHLLEYPLSSAYDLTSAGTRSWHRFTDPGPVHQLQGGIQFQPGRVEFNDDGTKLYGVFTSAGFIVGITSWTLETAWDISTLTKDAWEQDISDSYTDDNGNVLGGSTRGTFPTAFANDNFYIVDIFYSNAQGLDTNAIYRWDVSNIDYTYSGNRVLYEYSITNDTQSNTIDEGESVVFTISAPDIPDGSTVYWEVDPYSFTEIDDFDEATRSGTATFTNGTTTVTVNVLNDILDETNENERFNLRVARNENVGTWSALVQSNLISIGEVPWISLDHTIQTAGLASNDTLGAIKIDNGMNSTYTVIASSLVDDGSNTSSGEVYLYNNSTGALERTFTNPNAYGTTTGDNFGYAVGLSDSYLIAGAWQEDSAGGSGSGKAYVFNLSDGSLKYTLDNPNAYGTEVQDFFGHSVAISNDYAIVGAYYEDAGEFAQSSGAVYVFDMSDGSLAHTFTNPDTEPGTEDWFGFSVTINENYFAVGAPHESFDTSAVNYGGKVYLYRKTSSGWVSYLTVDNPGSSGASYHQQDQFGWDVALTNKHLVVGANGATSVDDSGTNYYSGRVDVFNLRDAAHLYSINNRAFGGMSDYFGDNVDGSDNFLIIGARDLDGTDNGGAYIYNINSGSYMTTLGNPNTYSGPDGDRFGSTVAILDDGSAAVSAKNEDTASTTDSGALYIYSSVYPGPTGVYTYKGIGDRGLIWGGTNSTYNYKIQYFDITTLGDAADFGTRYSGGGYAAAMSNSVRGIWAGGSSQENPSQGGENNSMHWVTTATLSNAYLWSTALSSTAWSAGVSDGDRGVFFGGTESSADASTFMNYISMSVASYQAIDFGDLALAAGEVGGAGHATYGIKAGGFYDDINKYRRVQMEKFTIQTTSSSAYLGDLTQARRKLTGTSNGTRGLFAGGIDFGRLNTIDYLTIATDTSATDFGDLADNTQGVSACSNETRAVFGGGIGDAGNISTLQYVSYDTPGNTSAFGSLVAGTNNEGGSGLSGASA
jgi:hypothetical protein